MNNAMLRIGDLKIESESNIGPDPIVDSELRVSIVSQITNIIETRISFLSSKIEEYKAASKEEQDKLFYALNPIVRSFIYKNKNSYKPDIMQQYFENDIVSMINKYKELLPYLKKFLQDKDQYLLNFLGLLKKNLIFLDSEKKDFDQARNNFIDVIRKDNKKLNKTKSVIFSSNGKSVSTQELNQKIADLEQQYDFIFQDDYQILKTIQNLFFDKENKICTNIEDDFYNRDINFSIENSKLSIFLDPKIVSLIRRYKIIVTNFLKKEVAVFENSMDLNLPEDLREKLKERKTNAEEGLHNTQKSLQSLNQPQVKEGDKGLESCIQMYIDHYPLLQLKNKEFEECFTKIAKIELEYVNFLSKKYGLLQRKKEILTSGNLQKSSAKLSSISSSSVSLKKQNIKITREDEFDELKTKEKELNFSIQGIQAEISELNPNIEGDELKALQKVCAEEETLKIHEQELMSQEAALKVELEEIAKLQQNHILAKKAQDIKRCGIETELKNNFNNTIYIPKDIIIENHDSLLKLFDNSQKISYDETIGILKNLGLEIRSDKAGSHRTAVYGTHKFSICDQHSSDKKILTYTNRSFICSGLYKILPTDWEKLSLSSESKPNSVNQRFDCSS